MTKQFMMTEQWILNFFAKFLNSDGTFICLLGRLEVLAHAFKTKDCI